MGEKVGSACLDENALIDIAQGKVKGDALAGAERHLAVCEDCSETLAAVGTIVNPTLRATKITPSARAPLACGTILNDTYRLLRLIGNGAMGDVYEAEHLHLEGRRAIKVLNVEPEEMAQARPRFMREAGIASALRHPNVVQVLDFNITNDDRPFLVMEFLEGQHFGDLDPGGSADGPGARSGAPHARGGGAGGDASPRHRSPQSQAPEHHARQRPGDRLSDRQGAGLRAREAGRTARHRCAGALERPRPARNAHVHGARTGGRQPQCRRPRR